MRTILKPNRFEEEHSELFSLRLRSSTNFKSKGNVVENGTPGKELVILKDYADIPPQGVEGASREGVEVTSTNDNLPVAGAFSAEEELKEG